MYSSFVNYQSRLIRVFDKLSKTYDLERIDATRPADEIFHQLQGSISRLFTPVRTLRKGGGGNGASRRPGPALTPVNRRTYNKAGS